MTKYNDEVLHTATDWFVLLTSGDATAQERENWQTWLKQDPAHLHAWQQIETVTGTFSGLDSKTSFAVLNRANDDVNHGRRQLLKSVGAVCIISSTSWYAYKEKPWHSLLADYSTKVGEIQNITLADGSKLVLNTDTKISVNYDEKYRNVHLLHGEIHIETANENRQQYRPFVVTTQHGSITALGTRFATRLFHDKTCVNVYEHAVEVRPNKANGQNVIVNAGEYTKFTTTSVQQKKLFNAGSDAWTKGFIIVDKMPLANFVEELSRYKSGVLRCDPAIAALEISGAFPVNDVDAALKSVSQILAVKVESFTSFWTTLKPHKI